MMGMKNTDIGSISIKKSIIHNLRLEIGMVFTNRENVPPLIKSLWILAQTMTKLNQIRIGRKFCLVSNGCSKKTKIGCAVSVIAWLITNPNRRIKMSENCWYRVYKSAVFFLKKSKRNRSNDIIKNDLDKCGLLISSTPVLNKRC